jgi:short-subunit dehydrogenase
MEYLTSEMYTYTGKTVLITGATSGIGEVFAQELATRGMHVILIAHSEDVLRSLAAELT